MFSLELSLKLNIKGKVRLQLKVKFKRKFKSPQKSEKPLFGLSPAFFWVLRQTPLNDTTTYTYDVMNRRKTRVLPGGQSESYLYDATGNVTSKTTFKGSQISYSYDPNTDRLIGESGPGVSNSYQYDASGYRVVMNDASGATTFNHDTRDRLVAKKSPFGNITYGYDNHGNLTSVSSSNTNGTNVEYQPDADNRLVSVTDNHGTRDLTSTYGYDNVGNLQNESLPNGASVTYQYDTLNRLTSMAATVGGSPIASYTYNLGAAGNRLSVNEISNRSVTYTYDNLYRLTSETITNDPASNNGTLGYSYDAVGNRQSRTSSVNAIPMQAFNGDYDLNDRLTAGFNYDSDGNTTSQGVTTYTYDGLDHLTSVSAPGLTESFVYDGDGNKVSQTVNGTTTNYLIDTANLTGYAQVLEELQGGNVNRVYTYGTNRISEDQLISGNWNLSFYGYDGQGSVRYLTNFSGTLTDTYTYDAFGNLISQTGTTPNVFLYDGEQNDSNLGQYYLRARFMNEVIGRFQNMDTYEGEQDDPLTLHKYLFTSNNPENEVDPSGNIGEGELAGEPTEKFPSVTANPYDIVVSTIIDAAAFNKIPISVLASLTYMESGWETNAMNKNSNGTIDVGVGQLNHDPSDTGGILEDLNPVKNIDTAAQLLIGKIPQVKRLLNNDKMNSKYSYVSDQNKDNIWFLAVWGYKGVNQQGYKRAENWNDCFDSNWPAVLYQDAQLVVPSKRAKLQLKVQSWEKFGGLSSN